MGIEQLLRSKREEVLAAARRHGARNVRVFGSVVRGQATDRSDVDLLVEFEDGRSLLDHASLVVELENLLNRRVEIATERGLREPYRHAVCREARPL